MIVRQSKTHLIVQIRKKDLDNGLQSICFEMPNVTRNVKVLEIVQIKFTQENLANSVIYGVSQYTEVEVIKIHDIPSVLLAIETLINPDAEVIMFIGRESANTVNRIFTFAVHL